MLATIQRSQTLALFKTKLILKNSYALTYLLLPLVMVAGMIVVFKMQLETSTLPTELLVLVANMGTILNIGSVAITIPAMLMAEEKEKHTLRTLMVSSVTPTEYLLGSLLPSFVCCLGIQALYLPILVTNLTLSSVVLYLVLSAVAILSANLMGACLGLFTKDQMTASLLPMPLTMIIMAIPMLADRIEQVKTINEYFFVSIASNSLMKLVNGEKVAVSGLQFGVMIATLLACLVVFYTLYKRNGFEED